MQSLMMKFFTTTYSKNMTNISFDNQSVVASIKIIVKNFGSVFIKIWIFEADTFKSIKNHEILRFYRILSNISMGFPISNTIFNDEIFCNHLFKKYEKYIIR